MSLVAQFKARFEALRGCAYVVATETEAAAVAHSIIREAGADCAAVANVSHEFQVVLRRLCGESGVKLLGPPFLSESLPGAIAGAGAGVTGCAFGIAETGTLVEVTTDDAVRLVSALPRTYIGVVRASEMVPRLMDAAPRLRNIFEGHDKNVVVSFISGPSRTGDIEMILTLGVHGPEAAFAIVIND